MAIHAGTKRSLGSILRSLPVALLPCAAAFGQTATPKPSFDVASVRVSPPSSPMRGQELLMSFTPDAIKGGLLSLNAPVPSYIIFAFNLTDMSEYRPLYEELPPWARNDKYAIEARVDPTATPDQIRQMMQSLLEERFQLKAHVETKQSVIYGLVLDKPGKTGPQLKPHDPAKPCATPATPTSPKPGSEPPATEAATTVHCGIDIVPVEGHLRLTMTGMTMQVMAGYVGGAAGYIGGMESHPIIDQTGLTGLYDLSIEFARAPDPGATPNSTTQEQANGPAFGDAMKSQLGLKLVKQTGDASQLIIDHIAPPSAN